jgi:lysophospholipase L1-like esterase
LETLRARAAGPAGPRTLAWALAECGREYGSVGARPSRVTNLFLDHYDADLALRPGSESAAYKRRVMRAVVARMRVAAASAGAQLLLLAIPDWRDLCEDCPHREEARGYPEYRPSALTDGLGEIARAEDVPLLDLFPAFRDWEGPELYHPRDGHWNEAGQALAARLAADRLAEMALP